MISQNSNFVLVLSGGGTKGLYTCGILKAIEEYGLKSRIDAIFGVSAGALIAAFWLSGWTADQILEKFLTTDLFSIKNVAFPPKFSLLKNTLISDLLLTDAKRTFEELEIPLYVGATDLMKAEFNLFSQWELLTPILWSLAIPGIFPSVEYQGKVLVDGGVMCNFPLMQAKEHYPNHKIIWVYLGQYQKDQQIHSLIDSLLLSYQILMQGHLLKDLDKVDYLFKRELQVGTMDASKEKIQAIFELGYQDGLERFQSLL